MLSSNQIRSSAARFDARICCGLQGAELEPASWASRRQRELLALLDRTIPRLMTHLQKHAGSALMLFFGPGSKSRRPRISWARDDLDPARDFLFPQEPERKLKLRQVRPRELPRGAHPTRLSRIAGQSGGFVQEHRIRRPSNDKSRNQDQRHAIGCRFYQCYSPGGECSFSPVQSVSSIEVSKALKVQP